MIANQMPDGDTKGTVPSKPMIALNIILLVLCVVVLTCFRGQALVDGLGRISEGHIYVAVSNWDIPVLVGLPCFLSLIVIMILRLIGYKSHATVQKLLNFSVVSAVVALLIRLPVGYLNSSYLHSAGYSPCWELSSPSLMAPTVWVSNAGYCIPSSASVRGEVLDWIDAQIKTGNHPTPNEMASEVSSLRKIGSE